MCYVPGCQQQRVHHGQWHGRTRRVSHFLTTRNHVPNGIKLVLMVRYGETRLASPAADLIRAMERPVHTCGQLARSRSYLTAFAYRNPAHRRKFMLEPVSRLSVANPINSMDIVSGARAVSLDGQSILERLDMG